MSGSDYYKWRALQEREEAQAAETETDRELHRKLAEIFEERARNWPHRPRRRQ